jgi:hypothetical protein
MHSDNDTSNDAADGEFDEGPLAWEWRVFAVAVVWSLPGFLLGALTCVFLPTDYLVSCLVGGGSLGALFGGLLEAGVLE